MKSKKLSDEIAVPFGIRTVEFSAEKGFLLNGKPLKLKGGCLHHDNGLLGAVAINRAEERKVELMKANGFNAVRCSHNLPSEYFHAYLMNSKEKFPHLLHQSSLTEPSRISIL